LTVDEQSDFMSWNDIKHVNINLANESDAVKWWYEYRYIVVKTILFAALLLVCLWEGTYLRHISYLVSYLGGLTGEPFSLWGRGHSELKKVSPSWATWLLGWCWSPFPWPLARLQLTLQYHGHGASAPRGVSVY